MNNFLASINKALGKPISNGSELSTGTYVVLGLVAVLAAIYMGWLKISKKGW